MLGAQLPQCQKLSRAARIKGAHRAGEVLRAKAKEAYQDICPLLKMWLEQGLTQEQIAHELNARGHTTRRGYRWNQSQVSRVLRAYVLPQPPNSQ